ncbi:SsgA family sporulation/cell division regulator [Kitasatospora sp. A2-31]|uniref:SsgA family sporulation/cell division regulator n=1 Tax=Kitasatospora sp. A2-31 TaxID=2916414 RepID=UPI001EEBDCFF|nr:SsgA family sporulation/cell division regulator [Kitasatospora sp. A2-31]MCG6493806.1 SsgA family sporulation/cell division regulator [Kitasatospora sp. A2-31]
MDHLTTRIAMRLVTDEEHGQELHVDWSYRTDDPHAITLDFGSYQADAVWTLSRDLLIAGMHAPAGEGDVHIALYDDTRMLIALGGSDGIALLAAPAEAVERFLTATTRLVPPGLEHTRIDWDQGLKDLLAA